MSSRRSALTFTLSFALGCSGVETEPLPPTGQVLLYVDTDAPVPLGPDEALGDTNPPALFDRLRIDLFAPGAREPCGGCSRDFELEARTLRERKASFGITPPPGGEGYVARARLFRSAALEGGEPPVSSTVEAYVELPAVGREGVLEVTALLLVDDVGVPQGSLRSPIAPKPGKPEASLVGSWPGARRIPCQGEPRDDEACVPGGAFWMGSPLLPPGDDGSITNQMRLVILSPFFMRLHETTVAEMRAAGVAVLAEDGSSLDPLEGVRSNPMLIEQGEAPYTIDDAFYYCNYLGADSGDAALDEVALNCVTWFGARAFCEARGGDLPTEAQYEYVAGALESKTYVWGNDAAGLSCDDAVWNRAGVGYFYDGISGACRRDGDPGGPVKPGTGKLDRLKLGEREVTDLAGNVAEWVADDWNGPSEPCWQDRPLLRNPLCFGQSRDGELRTMKGGTCFGTVLPAANRLPAIPDGVAPWIGFRCARPAD